MDIDKEKVNGEGDYWIVSTYPSLKNDDPLRRAYFAGVHDAESRCDDRIRAEAKAEAMRDDFRMDELDAVMLSVDKWLEGPALKNNPATRAADAREVALRAIESAYDRAKAEADKKYSSIFRWLLGEEGDFPASVPGRRYNWRGELRNRLSAILADQPKNTNSAVKVKIIDPGPGGIDGIMTFSDQATEAEKVEGPQVDDKVYVPPCEACGNVNRHNPSCPIMRERRIQEGR